MTPVGYATPLNVHGACLADPQLTTAWRHAWTSWTGLRLAIRSGASTRVDPIEFLRDTALPAIAQTLVAVRFKLGPSAFFAIARTKRTTC